MQRSLAVKNKSLFIYAFILYDLVVSLSNDMYLPAILNVSADLVVSNKLIEYTLVTWFLGSASLQMILGPCSDRFGRRAILLWFGGGSFLLSTILCAVSTNFYLFLLARFIQGSSICSIVVAGYAIIHELFDSKEAIKILATIGSITILAPALGPILGALIIETLHWRYIFLILFFLGLLSLLILYYYMPESSKSNYSLKLDNILYDYKNILTNPEFMRSMIMFCLSMSVSFFWIVESPFIIMKTYAQSSRFFGITQAFTFVAHLVGIQITKYLIDKYTPSKIIRIGLTILTLGSSNLILISYFHLNIICHIVSTMVLLVGAAMLLGPLNRLSVQACSEPMGLRMAIYSTLVNLFACTDSMLAIFIKDKTFLNFSLSTVLCIVPLWVIHFTTTYPSSLNSSRKQL